MMREKEKQIYYYKSYTDDFVASKNQDCELSEEYKWIHTKKIYRFFAGIVYVIARIFGFFYCRVFLHIKIENRNILRQYRQDGIFLYGNHTQPVGDVFLPMQICGRKHIYAIVSIANFGIPVVGKLLPMIGALPIPHSMQGMKSFLDAIKIRINEKKCIVIYPEAHVWPYCNFIRPFPATSFRYPVTLDAPSFCMTTTYQKAKSGKKPKIVVYIDGPFFLDKSATKKEQQKKLCNKIYECMKKRAQNNTYEYIRYEKEI